MEAPQQSGAEKNKSEHLVLLLAFIASPTPVVGNKAQPRGPPALRNSYLHNHAVVSDGGGGGARGSDARVTTR